MGGKVYYRLHSTNPTTLKPWDPIYFGTAGKTRFDPEDGAGTLYMAPTLGGALMEIFDDRWGPLGSFERSLTRLEISQWWVTLISPPSIQLFDATGSGLSRLGTDAQLLSGDHAIAREWALRLMRHPHGIGGIWYSSRHDPQRKNMALFQRHTPFPKHMAPDLEARNLKSWRRKPTHRGFLVHGPAVQLEVFPGLIDELCELEVPLIP